MSISKYLINKIKKDYYDDLSWLFKIKDNATEEAYQFYHQNIKPLPRKNDDWDFSTGEFIDNEVDAFRHAYTTGVFAQKFNKEFATWACRWLFNESTAEKLANTLGELHEVSNNTDFTNDNATNMDLWNNAVGSKYGLKAASKNDLGKMLQKALELGELIISPNSKEETRKHEKDEIKADEKPKLDEAESQQPLTVIHESDTGRNEWFFDAENKRLMSREGLVKRIENDEYLDYLVANINDIKTPKSKKDKILTNNLG
jgi:hypothetical protein